MGCTAQRFKAFNILNFTTLVLLANLLLAPTPFVRAENSNSIAIEILQDQNNNLFSCMAYFVPSLYANPVRDSEYWVGHPHFQSPAYLMISTIKQKMPTVLEKWRRVYPENVERPEVLQMLALSEGYELTTDGKLIKTNGTLTTQAKQFISALRFLVRHDLAIFTYYSGIPVDAPPLVSPDYFDGAPLFISPPHLVRNHHFDIQYGDPVNPIEFAINEMTRAGLVYVERRPEWLGIWIPGPNFNTEFRIPVRIRPPFVLSRGVF